MSDASELLRVEDLHVHYAGRGKGVVRALAGVSVCVSKGQSLGIVGESGCGKSTLARAVMGLVKPESGRVVFDGCNLSAQPARELRHMRLDFQMVFQDPFSSLDPAMSVSDIIAEAVVRREKLPGAALRERVSALLERVGLPADIAESFPHEFSGGQRQRIAIARALATRPKLLVADEAVSALDVSVQSQILNLLNTLRREDSLAMLFISHDLSVVRHVCDRIAVMYLGRIVETGTVFEVLDSPLHMYTKALISASPLSDPVLQRGRKRIALRGDPPSPSNPPPGCAFAWRSPIEVPPEVAATPGRLREVSPGRKVEIHPATVEDPSALDAMADAIS
jgi:oligopeptide transport system ATP-binding protein